MIQFVRGISWVLERSTWASCLYFFLFYFIIILRTSVLFSLNSTFCRIWDLWENIYYGKIVEALHIGLCLAIYWPHNHSAILPINSTLLHLVNSDFLNMWVWSAVGQGTGAWPCSEPMSPCSAFCNMVWEEIVTQTVWTLVMAHFDLSKESLLHT